MDSNDRERLQEARDELHGIMDSDEMRGVPVVVIANKQDLPRKLVYPRLALVVLLRPSGLLAPYDV